MAAPIVSPRQLVLPGAGTTTYWLPFPPSSATATHASSSITPLPTSSALVRLAKHHFNILYLIPVFAVVGLSILVGILWLTHGCCTRKPRYRSLPRPQVDDSFKAFKYEDIPPNQPCPHVKDYGFECDCLKEVNLGDGKIEEGCLGDMGKVHVRELHRVVVQDVIASVSPLSRLGARIKGDSAASWMGKVVHAFGSSGSSLSGDKYTVVPESGSMRRDKKRKAESRQQRPQSTPLDTTFTAEREEERVKRMVQKRRLQNHRESIASLPAGMVFSPPVVAFAGFGEVILR